MFLCLSVSYKSFAETIGLHMKLHETHFRDHIVSGRRTPGRKLTETRLPTVPVYC